MLFILLIILSVIAGYSLDCREGPMKKNSFFCLFVCGFVSGSKVKGQKNIGITTSENLVISG